MIIYTICILLVRSGS